MSQELLGIQLQPRGPLPLSEEDDWVLECASVFSRYERLLVSRLQATDQPHLSASLLPDGESRLPLLRLAGRPASQVLLCCSRQCFERKAGCCESLTEHFEFGRLYQHGIIEVGVRFLVHLRSDCLRSGCKEPNRTCLCGSNGPGQNKWASLLQVLRHPQRVDHPGGVVLTPRRILQLFLFPLAVT